jgi:hypothetical protein
MIPQESPLDQHPNRPEPMLTPEPRDKAPLGDVNLAKLWWEGGVKAAAILWPGVEADEWKDISVTDKVFMKSAAEYFLSSLPTRESDPDIVAAERMIITAARVLHDGGGPEALSKLMYAVDCLMDAKGVPRKPRELGKELEPVPSVPEPSRRPDGHKEDCATLDGGFSAVPCTCGAESSTPAEASEAEQSSPVALPAHGGAQAAPPQAGSLDPRPMKLKVRTENANWANGTPGKWLQVTAGDIGGFAQSMPAALADEMKYRIEAFEAQQERKDP